MHAFTHVSRIAAGLMALTAGLLLATAVSAAPFMVTYTGPTSVFVNATADYTANYETGGATIERCVFSADGVSQGNMTLSGSATNGSASFDYAFTSSGAHTVRVTCYDDDLGDEVFDEEPLTVFADAVGPLVSNLRPVTATAGTAVNIAVDYDDTDFGSGIQTCGLIVDGAESGAMSLSGGVGSTAGTASLSYTFSASGDHTVRVNCFDRSGNLGTVQITAAVSAAADIGAPTLGTPSPVSAAVNVPVNITASVTDDVGVTSCTLYVDGALIGSMSLSGSTASRSYTFTTTGTHTVNVQCSDAAGNSSSAPVTVNVSASTGLEGNLIKLACPTSGVVDVNHPCRAVYYVSSSARRHAFPNEKVYFTWYTNFSGIVEVSNETMASIALGSNVTYRPGIKMVKFTTDPKVYAVARYGTLRWVTNESIAVSLYGSNWNTRIDDISDAFYTNYTFGANINSPAYYNPSAESAAATTIDANL